MNLPIVKMNVFTSLSIKLVEATKSTRKIVIYSSTFEDQEELLASLYGQQCKLENREVDSRRSFAKLETRSTGEEAETPEMKQQEMSEIEHSELINQAKSTNQHRASDSPWKRSVNQQRNS